MCNHERQYWIGKSDGVYCRKCGAKIDPSKYQEPKAEPKAEPKKGGKKNG